MRILAVIGVVLLVALGAAAWAAHTYGPRFGLYLWPPSPNRYATVALDLMESGYYAQGPAWEAERARIEELGASAGEIADLHAPLAAAAEVAGGKHSFFLTPAEANESSASAEAEFTSPSVTTRGGVTTVRVAALGTVSPERQQEYATRAAEGIAQAAPGTCGWIVDLRDNTGGDMNPMLSGVSPLLPNGTAVTFRSRTGHTSAVSIHDDGAGMDGTAVPIPQVAKVTGQPIAVLQDGRTASSGEAVLTAFLGLDRVQTFGSDSAGYSSANGTYRLYDGAQLILTSSVYVARDGRNLNEQPIPPDHAVDPRTGDRAAAAWLAGQACR